MLGYLYQCREALLLAIVESKRRPSLSVSIERFDDVAFEDAGTPTEQLQIKHHINAASLSDRSVDLWKTLRIWSEQVSGNPQLPFERLFSIVTTATAPEGSVAELLRVGKPHENAVDLALELLLKAARESTNKASEDGRGSFLALSRINQRNLIASMRVHDQSPSITDVRSEIEDLLTFSAPAGKASLLVDHLEGWWFSQVVVSLSHAAAPAISLVAVRQKIDEIASAFRAAELLINPDVLSVSEDKFTASDDRIFVQQMRYVDIADEAVKIAKRDYYRATAQRSAWVRENALLDGEAARYDANLIERWKRESLARSAESAPLSDDEKKRFGRGLFHWANRDQLPFRNRHEQWLCSGSYQILADRVAVGWHPEHSSIFNTVTKSKAA